VIPAESLLAHMHSNGRAVTTWHPVPELAELQPGEVAGFVIAETTILACRVDDQTFAYRDHCPVCDDSLAGAGLHGPLLRCPRCQADFDVVHAGARVAEGSGHHLDPIPLLPRDGLLSVALRDEAIGASA
jgi:nitrite reductase/ring-hydroxylating ferredoxin subunit